MVKPIKSSSTTPSTQAPLSVDAIFQQLSTMQQLQLYVRESLLRVVLPSLSIMKQQASNAASSVEHDDDEISQMIANSHLKQHSSDDQKQAFEELMAQICNELNIKHRLETRSQLDTDDAVNEHMDSLYQKIFEKVQPKSQNINSSSSSSDDSSSMTRSTSSAAAKVEEKKRKKLTKEREQELQQTIKSFSDDSIQKCVTFLKKEAAALTPTHGGSISALRIHSLLFQLTVHQKYNKIMECGIVHVWISPVLKNGPPMSVIKFMCIQWYTLLMSVYRAVVARAAQVNYIQNTQRQEREKQEAETGGATQASNKNVNKENRKKKPQQQIEEEEELDEMDDEVFDPEKAMFGEDKKESEESTNTDPNSFDEENVSALLKMKQQLLNKESLRSAIDFVLNQTPNRRETVAWSYIVFMCLQLLTDALNSTTSQDRFEQFVDLLSDINVIDLFSDLLDSDMIQKASELGGAVVDNKFRIDYREIVENSLYTLSVMMNHEHTIPQSFLQYVCDAAIAVLYAFTDPEADSKEEHNICNDVYIVSLCCYIIAKVCGKSSKITNQVVKKYCLQPSAEEDLLARLVSLIKYKKPIFVNINSNTTNQRRPLVMNAYAALSSLIKNKGLAQRVIAMEEHDDQKKDYSLVDTLVADINGQKGDTNAWELRYSAMVLLKYFSLLIKPYKNAGPIFSKLLEANVIETMVTHLTNRNKAKKKGQKTEDETDGFLHHRYLLPSTLAALNSLFHNAKENGDPTNIDTLKTIVATNEDFQGILSFLSAMERQKVETGIPYWLIMILVVVFVVFLILIPIFYNFARPSVNRG